MKTLCPVHGPISEPRVKIINYSPANEATFSTNRFYHRLILMGLNNSSTPDFVFLALFFRIFILVYQNVKILLSVYLCMRAVISF